MSVSRNIFTGEPVVRHCGEIQWDRLALAIVFFGVCYWLFSRCFPE